MGCGNRVLAGDGFDLLLHFLERAGESQSSGDRVGGGAFGKHNQDGVRLLDRLLNLLVVAKCHGTGREPKRVK